MTTKEIPDCETRNTKLAGISQESALLALNKAKSLVMAYWHGETIASTKQVGDFYSANEDSLRKLLIRHHDEFYADGVRKLEGKELQAARDILSLSVKATSVSIWTPRAILRAGMLLQNNEIAKQVRNVVLDQVEQNPNPQQLGLFPDGGQEVPVSEPPVSAPRLAEIAEAIEIATEGAKLSRKIIALAKAEAIAQTRPDLSGAMSVLQKYLR
jgi:hypothetical protein